MTQSNTAMPCFSTLGIEQNILTTVRKKFTNPTPIQHRVIPEALQGKDIIGIAETGSGKTLAFGIPLIQRLIQLKGQGLILVPTRELALQVDEMLQHLGRPLGLKTMVIIGGAPAHYQKQMLRRDPHIIIATPGRLIDHLRQKNHSLHQTKVIILDEADRMFDIGFMPQIKIILSEAPRERQTLLFSATMPDEIAKLTERYMKIPLRIDVSTAGKPPAQIEQGVFLTNREAKIHLLSKLLNDHSGTVLVFSRTKHNVKKITRKIRDMGHSAAEIHSNRSLGQRKDALAGFKSGKYRVLVATDIASRGIDVNNISLVINYDLPDNSEDYVHRIGRTGRAGNKGKALTFATHEERRDIRAIERLIQKELPFLNAPSLPMYQMDSKLTDNRNEYRNEYPPRRQNFGYRRRAR